MSSKQFFFKLNEGKEKLLPNCKRHCISIEMIIFDKLTNHLFLIENSVDCSFEKEDGLMSTLELLLLLNEPEGKLLENDKELLSEQVQKY